MIPKIGYKPVPLATNAKRFAKWNGQPPRAPRRGEVYLDPSLTVAHIAGADMTTPHFIGEPMSRIFSRKVPK